MGVLAAELKRRSASLVLLEVVPLVTLKPGTVPLPNYVTVWSK